MASSNGSLHSSKRLGSFVASEIFPLWARLLSCSGAYTVPVRQLRIFRIQAAFRVALHGGLIHGASPSNDLRFKGVLRYRTFQHWRPQGAQVETCFVDGFFGVIKPSGKVLGGKVWQSSIPAFLAIAFLFCKNDFWQRSMETKTAKF